jgi:hypothetical protein
MALDHSGQKFHLCPVGQVSVGKMAFDQKSWSLFLFGSKMVPLNSNFKLMIQQSGIDDGALEHIL